MDLLDDVLSMVTSTHSVAEDLNQALNQMFPYLSVQVTKCIFYSHT